MRIGLLFFLCLGFTALLGQVGLPDCYHTYSEIEDFLTQMHDAYPNQMHVEVIGYSQNDHIPIYAVKISQNAEEDEDQPELLFVGQVHAEEVLGTEIVLSEIHDLLTLQTQYPYHDWLEATELWFIPTMNPEGYNVVLDGVDNTYRKNKRDVNGNGIFDFTEGVGSDYDGVDLNRNFGYNWVHGDTLLTPPSTESPEEWDYYRGTGPFSESESQAIRNFAAQHHFIYSINWHSSRSGRYKERVYFSYDWESVRPSPDLDLAHEIGFGVAGKIIKESEPGTYLPAPTATRRGATNDWFYQQHGTIQLLIECGSSNIQPGDSLRLSTIQRCHEGVKWLINRTNMFSAAPDLSSMLTGHITDAVTGTPLSAEVIIRERNAPYLAPRMSDSLYGRYWRPLEPGIVTLEVRKKGYHTYVLPTIIINGYSWTIRNIALTPLAPATFTGQITSGGSPIAAQIVIDDLVPDTLQVTDGSFSFNTYEGVHRVQITAEGYFPYIDTLQVTGGNQELHVDLSPATIIFAEHWENGTGAWCINGPWQIESQLSHAGFAITDSWGGSGFYAPNCNVWIRTLAPIPIPATQHTILAFWQHLYTECDYDPARVEVSRDSVQWDVLLEQSGQKDWWHPMYLSLDNYAGESIYLRFRLTDVSPNANYTDPGWTMDDITILSGVVTAANDPIAEALIPVQLGAVYPNPFNPETHITFTLPERQQAALSVFNIRGQLVCHLIQGVQDRGKHNVIWRGVDDQGRAVASGLYFFRLETGKQKMVRKAVLLK